MNIRSLLVSASVVLTATVAIAGLCAGPAAAQDIVTTDQESVVAVNAAHAPAHRGPQARASVPGGIEVTGHGGYPVSVSAAGEPTLRVSRPGDAPARFRGLTPGTTYRVAVNERPIASVTVLSRPRAATDLVVRTTSAPNAVAVSWKHTATRATGGKGIDYVVRAKPADGPAISATVHGRTTARLTGLNPDALYRFFVTPRNSAGSGPSTAAAMTRTLAQLRGNAAVVPATPTPEPIPAVIPPAKPSTPPPAVTSEPARPAPPATRTIYVCPDGFAESGGLCQRTLAYTYSLVPYTYHSEPIYGYGQVGWDYAWGHCSGAGTSGNWPNGDPYCRTPVYGDNAVVGSQQVKDATPSGYTDTGSSWSIRDAAPAGYLDDGHQWVMTVAKQAREVPA